MAGSGKTTLAARLGTYLSHASSGSASATTTSSSATTGSEGPTSSPVRIPYNPYMVNLDPAVQSTPYEPAIDIRDTVHYKNVMAEYKLGPNGGILTCLNLFATRFDQVVALLEKRRGGGSGENGEEPSSSPSDDDDAPISHAIIDTPGQIEIFAWSASGSIMTDALARSLSLVLDEFTSALPHVSVSAATGQGMPELVEKLEECRRRYYEEYRPGIEAARGARREAEAARRAAELGRLRADGGIGEEGVEGLERAVRAVNIGGGEGEEEGSGGAP